MFKVGSVYLAIAFATAVGIAASSPARADEASAPVSVKVNMARILRISAPAATVIVGNPGVADVTIQDPRTLVLTGKSYGQTNMIVLDSKGNPIADTLVEVVQSQADIVTVYNAGERNTVACAPTCYPTVMLGDSPNYSQQLIQSMNQVQGIAQ
jgi:Pilus formation protein N terminal region